MQILMKSLKVFMCLAFVLQTTGCGTILYPERKGQKDGRIDIGVAVLDGIGLLFFLIPGIIAYAVDFNNGTIYLPNSSRASLKEIKFNPKLATAAEIEKIIKDETGKTVKLDQENVQITKLKSVDEMKVKFAQASHDMESSRLALLK